MTKMKIRWPVTGAAFGYLIFHPLVHIIFLAHYFADQPRTQYFASGISGAFSVSMLPWSLAFTLLSALIGMLWAKILQADKEKSEIIIELQKALERVKALNGLLPICASCKKIRDDRGYWNQIEAYIEAYSEAQFSHGICPDCAEKLYPEFYRPNKSSIKKSSYNPVNCTVDNR
jgi:hypothetical protein